MGAGPRYPYPRDVWSPAGGWWSRPKNWRSNTLISFGMLGVATYFTWTFSAEREIRHRPPTRWIPSMMWAKQFTSGEMGIRDEGQGESSASH